MPLVMAGNTANANPVRGDEIVDDTIYCAARIDPLPDCERKFPLTKICNPTKNARSPVDSRSGYN
jgi:hypothetical protein